MPQPLHTQLAEVSLIDSPTARRAQKRALIKASLKTNVRIELTGSNMPPPPPSAIEEHTIERTEEDREAEADTNELVALQAKLDAQLFEIEVRSRQMEEGMELVSELQKKAELEEVLEQQQNEKVGMKVPDGFHVLLGLLLKHGKILEETVTALTDAMESGEATLTGIYDEFVETESAEVFLEKILEYITGSTTTAVPSVSPSASVPPEGFSLVFDQVLQLLAARNMITPGGAAALVAYSTTNLPHMMDMLGRFNSDADIDSMLGMMAKIAADGDDTPPAAAIPDGFDDMFDQVLQLLKARNMIDESGKERLVTYSHENIKVTMELLGSFDPSSPSDVDAVLLALAKIAGEGAADATTAPNIDDQLARVLDQCIQLLLTKGDITIDGAKCLLKLAADKAPVLLRHLEEAFRENVDLEKLLGTLVGLAAAEEGAMVAPEVPDELDEQFVGIVDQCIQLLLAKNDITVAGAKRLLELAKARAPVLLDALKDAFKDDVDLAALLGTLKGLAGDEPSAPDSARAQVEVSLPPHPRAQQRSTTTFEHAIQGLLQYSGCLSLKGLMEKWAPTLARFASIVKIGFPVGANATDRSSMMMADETVGRLTMSKDGNVITFKYPAAFGKESVEFKSDFVTGVTVARGASEEGGEHFNDVSFTIHYDGEEGSNRIGPFTPPVELELRAWVFVLGTLAGSRGGGGGYCKKVKSVARMVTAEASKDGGFWEGVERVGELVKAIGEDVEGEEGWEGDYGEFL